MSRLPLQLLPTLALHGGAGAVSFPPGEGRGALFGLDGYSIIRSPPNSSRVILTAQMMFLMLDI